MTPPAPDRAPTEAELKILNVLWEHGPLTVRQVHDHLREREEIGHTTVLKLMQIMTEKGLLLRDAEVRPQIFRAVEPRGRTQRRLLRQLVDRAFRGSPGTLVLQALALRKSTPEELAEIRRMLDELEGRKS